MKFSTVGITLAVVSAGTIDRYKICDTTIDTVTDFACKDPLDDCCTVFQKGYAPTNICLPKSTSNVEYDCGKVTAAANIGADQTVATAACVLASTATTN